MTISFSGLASGLDTSSWITSLTALKQAKVTVLQQEREELVVSKDTLSSIRSFFSSFRSVIERVTDTRFNIPALDLFAQNIAKSANLDVFTASATTEAEEGSYDITVKKLATKTKAISDYRYKTTITETTTATGDSYLKHIGITAGQVLINTPAGVQRTLEIEENETMSSLIEKFKEIGVNASYNDKSGVFTVDISASDINDIGATNIVDALHLQGVNEGYDSNVLQFKTVETVFYAASYDTKLSELGTGIAIPGTQTVVVKNSNNEELTINVDETTTIGQLFQQMNDFGLYATLSEEGVVEISGGSIVGGTFDAISALGLDSDPFTGYVVGEPLTETIWVYELVTMDTLLVDQLGVKEGYLEVEDSEGDKQYLKIYSGQTIGDLMADLANMGIYSTLDKETGVLTITGGAFTTLSDTDVNALVANGTIAEPDERYRHGTDLIELLYGAPAITVDQTQVSQTYAMSRALTYEVVHTINATTSTFMHELGVNTNEQVVIYNVEGAQSTINISGTTELGTLMNAINAVDGVTATLTDGILHIEGGYIRNTAVEEALGLDREEHAFSNVIGTQMSYTTIIQATKDTTLGQITHALGTSGTVAGGYTLLFNSFDVGTTEDMTIQELMDKINDLGGTAFIDSTGKLTIEGGTLTGTVATALGFVTMSTTSAVSATGELLCTIVTIAADSTTKVSEIGLGDSTISIKGHDGVEVGTIDVNSNMTLGEVFSALAGFGITATINNGVVSLQSDEKGYYAEGGLIDSIGVGQTTSTYTTTASVTNSSQIDVQYNVTATGDTTMGELALSGAVTIKGHDGEEIGVIQVDSDMTINELFSALAAYDIEATISNGVVTLESACGNWASGGVIDGMGVGTTETNYTTTAAVTNSSGRVTYDYTVTANGDTTMGELGLSGNVTVKGVDGVSVGTVAVDSDMTMTELFAALAAYGISGTISGGVVSMSSKNGNYAEGGVLTGMSMSTSSTTTTQTIGTSHSSSAITCSYTITANGSTTFGELGISGSASVYGIDGVSLGSVAVGSDMTLDSFLAALASYGIEGSMSGGIVSLSSTNGAYATGGVITALGIGTTSSTSVQTTGTSTTGSAQNFNTVTTKTEYPTLTRTIFTTSTLVTTTPIIGSQTVTIEQTITTTQPVIGSQTIIVTHTHTCTEVVGGTSTIYQTHTIVDTVPVIGSQTVIVTHTHVVTEPVIVPDSQVLSVTTPVTYTDVSYSNKTITLSGTKTVTITGSEIVEGAVTQTIITTYTTTVTTPITDTEIQTVKVTQSNCNNYQLDETTTWDGFDAGELNGYGVVILKYIDGSWKGVGDFAYDGNTYISALLAGMNSIAQSNGAGSYIYSINSSGQIVSSDSNFRFGGSASSALDFNSDVPPTAINLGSVVAEVTVTTGYDKTTYTHTTTSTSDGSAPMTVYFEGTSVVSYNLTTVVPVVTGTDEVTLKAIGYVTVDSVTTTTRTVTTYTTHTVEKTTTKPVTHKIVTSDVIPTYTYKTVTHQSTTTHVVEKTTTTVITDTIKQVFTVEHTTTAPITHTIIGTCVIETTTYKITTTTSSMTMTGDTLFSQLGSSASVTVYHNGASHTVTGSGNQSVNDFLTALAGFGISGTISGGVVTLTCDKGSYITAASGLGLSSAYTTQTHTITTNDGAGDQLTATTTSAMTSATTFTKLGGSASFTVVSDGVQHVVSASGNQTVGDLIDTLAGLGIKATISGGVLTLEGDEQAWVTGSTGVFGMGSAYTTTVHTITTNTAGNQQKYDTTDAMTTDTLFSTIGGGGTMVVVQNGVEYSITMSGDHKVGDLLTALAGYGIAGTIVDGVLTLQGSDTAYVLSNSISGLLFDTGEDVTYDSTTHTITANTSSAEQNFDTVITTATRFWERGMSGTGTITVIDEGVEKSVSVGANDSIDDLISSLAGVGIKASVSGGRITFEGDGETFILDISSNLVSALELGSTNWDTTTHTITSNTSSDQQLQTIYETATGATTLGDLRHWDGSALGSYEFVLDTISDAGNESVTLNFSAGTTLHDVIDRLADYGINANIDSAGRFTMSSSSLTDFDAGGAVGTFLMGAYTKKYDEGKLTHTSTNLIQETVVRMDENTKFSDIGVTTGDILLHIDGDIHTIHIDTNDTVGSFMQKLEDYNIEASIIDGQLALRGEHVVYTSAPDTNASNIIDKMNIGFDDWNLGSFSQTSDWLTDTEIRDDRITGDTKLVDLQDEYGNSLNITTGEYVVYSNGVRTVETVTADTTIDDFITTMSTYAMVAETNSSGQLAVGAQHNSYLATAASSGDDTNLIDVLFAEWNFVNIYTSNNLDIPEDVTIAISETTKLADINEGAYEDGNFVITKDGVQTVVSLTADDTVGTLMDELELFGFETVINNSGQLIVKGTNATLSNYTGPNKASNILDIMNITSDEWVQTEIFHNDCLETSDVVTTWTNASEETLLENLDIVWTDPATNVVGDLMVTVDGSTSAIHIDAGESVGSLIEKFRSLGLEASISNGKLIVQSGYKDFVIETAGTTSNIMNDFGLTYNADMGGYVASVAVCEQTTTRVEDRALSASSYASDSTLMSLLNITSGTLSVYRNGEKATILIKSDETFGQLRSRIATAFADVDIEFEDGYLKFYSNTGESVEVGSTTDTSNFSAICGLTNDKSGTVYSARELYSVNSASKITTAGLFRRDDVTEGTFIIGDATFTIDENTTMQNLISQINSSEDANAVAYWDSVDGRLVLTSRTTGSSFINVEAGTSNFTDVMGYTTTTRQADGITVDKTKLDIGAQEVGENAVFTINGTTYSSTSNTIESDISRITGVTINLKGLSEEGETVTLTVERDKETLANAVSDVVDAYNALIENVDKEVAKGAALSDQFTLKLIRNQIRNLMTSSLGSATVFKNMDAIGISLDKASTGNIDTSTINVLSFDKDKFFKAFEADQEAVKALVVGTDATQGILTKIETVVEQALTSASGYFSSADKSFNSQISRMDNKIKKAQEAVERYKARLETKFSAMDLLISKIQNQYSSFLGG